MEYKEKNPVEQQNLMHVKIKSIQNFRNIGPAYSQFIVYRKTLLKF